MWLALGELIRRACSMYHAGNSSDAGELIRASLPGMIDRWNRLSPLSGEEKKRRLFSLFIEEGRRAGEPALAQKLLVQHMRVQEARNLRTRQILSSAGPMVETIRLMEEGPDLCNAETSRDEAVLALEH